MRVDEELSLLERALARDPVDLNLYRVARLSEKLTPEQALRVAEGLDILSALLEAAGVKGMTVQAAMDAGLITKADYWGAFGMAPPG